MNTLETCQEALRKGVSMELTYDGVFRKVEVHALGISKAGNIIARVFQYDTPNGSNISHNDTGWKLLTLSKADEVKLTGTKSLAPRPGYSLDDKAMVEIIEQYKTA